MKFYVIGFFFLIACSNKSNQIEDQKSHGPKSMNFIIAKIYQHDTLAFTEGLLYLNGYLYESTGLEKKTTIKKINLNNNTIIKENKINDTTIFGEGITNYKKFLYQLTWKNKICYVYDTANLKKIKSLLLPFKEAWGITHNDTALIVSDGSSKLYFLNPNNVRVVSSINVTDNNGPVGNINELEFIRGYIYANVWQTNKIIKINPENGNVEANLDLAGLLDKTGILYNPDKIDVLNGIAYDSIHNYFFITGKLWPALFALKIN
jgi:glutamine cyclotransferase